MAIITTSSIVSEIRGSIGGITFTRSAAGAVARRRVKPCAATTNAVATQRAIHSIKVSFWRDSLTDAQRLVWNTTAETERWINRLGEEFIPSGYQLFIRQAQPIPQLPAALPTAPVLPLKTPSGPLVLSWDEPTQRIYVDTPTNFLPPANGWLRRWYATSLPPSHYHFSGRWYDMKIATFVGGLPIHFYLWPSPVTFRPCRIFVKFRTFLTRYTPSEVMIYSISIPPTP